MIKKFRLSLLSRVFAARAMSKPARVDPAMPVKSKPPAQVEQAAAQPAMTRRVEARAAAPDRDDDGDTEELKGRGVAGEARLRERRRWQLIMSHPAAAKNVALAKQMAESPLSCTKACALLSLVQASSGLPWAPTAQPTPRRAANRAPQSARSTK